MKTPQVYGFMMLPREENTQGITIPSVLADTEYTDNGGITLMLEGEVVARIKEPWKYVCLRTSSPKEHAENKSSAPALLHCIQLATEKNTTCKPANSIREHDEDLVLTCNGQEETISGPWAAWWVDKTSF